jgi:hypothetical protein
MHLTGAGERYGVRSEGRDGQASLAGRADRVWRALGGLALPSCGCPPSCSPGPVTARQCAGDVSGARPRCCGSWLLLGMSRLSAAAEALEQGWHVARGPGMTLRPQVRGGAGSTEATTSEQRTANRWTAPVRIHNPRPPRERAMDSAY